MLERSDRAGARASWEQALALLQRQERANEVLQLRCLRATLLPAADARAEVDALLAEAALDTRPHWRALAPEALLACLEVLERAAGAQDLARAAMLEAALAARLAEQLAQFDGPDAAAATARGQLLHQVPWWHALRSRGAAGAA
jgi:hypothetical protein